MFEKDKNDLNNFEDDDFDMSWEFMDSLKKDNDEDEDEGSEDKENEDRDTEDREVELDADAYGTEVDLKGGLLIGDEGKSEEEYSVVIPQNNFIDDNGDIVVMDNDDPEDDKRFESDIIPIERISLSTERIRKNVEYESLYKSVKSTGLLEPLVVAPTKTEGYYILLHGYRRLMACAKCGMKKIPCVINHRVKTGEIPILEALYNHSSKYSMKDIVAYINYLEKEKNIMNASLIEFLAQLDNGDYNKLKDIQEDDDPDIFGKLLNDQITIAKAYKDLENKRKKLTKAEKELSKADKAYNNAEEDGGEASKAMSDSGIVVNDSDIELTDEEVKAMTIDPQKLDESVEEKSLDEMVSEGKQMEGFEDHKQDWKNRERIDPAIRKAVMSRDNNTCQCCKRGGPDYVDILDLHHIVEVYHGGVDSVENSITLCLNCHKQVHLYARNELHLPKSKTPEDLETDIKQQIITENAVRVKKGLSEMNSREEELFRDQKKAIYKEEQDKYKRIVKLGNVIREGMIKRGQKLEDFKKQHPIDKIGRQKPGEKNEIA